MLSTPLADLVRQITPKPLVSPPPQFDGTLGELFADFIVPNLPLPSAMTAVHRTLVDYCNLPDSLLLLRYLGGEIRGQMVRTTSGRYRPTDNSPAWLMHFIAFNGIPLPGATHLEPLVAEWPCHIFELASLRIRTVAHHGWHIAHLLPAKDRQTDPTAWTRAILLQRFIRNIHPCNYSYLPKPEWPRYGADETVIAFLVREYRQRYSDIWSEFALLAGHSLTASKDGRNLGGVRYSYSASADRRRSVRESRPEAPPGPADADIPLPSVPATLAGGRERRRTAAIYSATRLLFRRDVIDPLASDESFRVQTPEGVFEFRKADFLRVFANVVASASYRDRGIYSYVTTPGKAMAFRV